MLKLCFPTQGSDLVKLSALSRGEKSNGELNSSATCGTSVYKVSGTDALHQRESFS